MITGKIFNIQRYSIDDGPGIRTTVFLKGCPLRCKWCSNPESQNAWPEIVHRDSFCHRCGTCITACPEKAIVLGDKGIEIDRQRCTNCGRCAEVCPYNALEMVGQEMLVDDVLSEVRRDAEYYRVSGGGVTASGGEPLSQADFVAELFARCGEEGIHTCLDTSGYASPGAFKKVLAYTNIVFFDIKHTDPERHEEMTKHQNGVILDNLQIVVKSGVDVIIRIPVLSGLNSTVEEMADTAKLIRDSGLNKVHLLPYHKYGVGKYEMLDREYPLEDLVPPAPEELEAIVRMMNKYSLDCEVRI